MTLDTEQRIERTAPAETAAKPPPPAGGERSYRLFQTMDELRTRNGNRTDTKQRMMQAAAALIGGSLLFAALYAVILFVE